MTPNKPAPPESRTADSGSPHDDSPEFPLPDEATSRAIGRGFELYSIVLAAAIMLALPAAVGYYIDQWLGLMAFAPIGAVLGIVVGLRFLLTELDGKRRQ